MVLRALCVPLRGNYGASQIEDLCALVKLSLAPKVLHKPKVCVQASLASICVAVVPKFCSAKLRQSACVPLAPKVLRARQLRAIRFVSLTVCPSYQRCVRCVGTVHQEVFAKSWRQFSIHLILLKATKCYVSCYIICNNLLLL